MDDGVCMKLCAGDFSCGGFFGGIHLNATPVHLMCDLISGGGGAM